MKNKHTITNIFNRRYSILSCCLFSILTVLPCNAYATTAATSINLTAPTIKQTGLDAKQHTLCMIGSSMAGDLPIKKGSGNVAAPVGLFKASGFVSLTSIKPQPKDGLYLVSGFTPVDIRVNTPFAGDQNNLINSARFTYHILEAKADCSSLSYYINNNGDIQDANNTLPASNDGLFEFTLDMAGIHADTSNVDDFQALINIGFYDATPALLGEAGQPVGASNPDNVINKKDILAGYQTWVRAQSDTAKLGVSNFSALLDTGNAVINSPTQYLLAKGTVNKIPGVSLNFTSPLNRFFDSSLKALFVKGLKVMGDQIGTPPSAGGKGIAQQYYTLTSSTSCPWTIETTSKNAFEFVGDDSKTKLIICNPVDMVFATLPVNKVETAITAVESGTWPAAPTKEKPITATDKFSFTVTPDPSKSKSITKGMIFGQPDTGFSGIITDISGSKVTVNKTVGYPNTSYPSWAFTTILPSYNSQNLKQFESSARMVFAGDGIFSDGAAQYPSNANMQVLLNSVERNINEALNRGVALCNNNSQPAICKGMTNKSPKTALVPAKQTANDTATFWGTESNWFPANGAQNYYQQFLHTYQLADKKGHKHNISLVPNNGFLTPSGCTTSAPVQNSFQGIPMGMTYGQAYDENPVYSGNPCISNVPSKWDPAPQSTATIKIKLGPQKK